MKIRVCVAGATGWVGLPLCAAILDSDDLELVGVVARATAGQQFGKLIDRPSVDLTVCGSVEEALAVETDVLVDYTRPEIGKANVSLAMQRRIHTVIGTSGFTDTDYEEIDRVSQQNSVGVLAAGNFAITAVLMQVFAEMAAKHVPSWEIIDYAHADKVDAPSGTTRELAYRLGKVGPPQEHYPVEKTRGEIAARGATLNGTQIHSLRIPGFIISAEVIFGLPDERISIRHDAGSGAGPYVGGTLLAIRRVSEFTGLKRGLDSILEF